MISFDKKVFKDKENKKYMNWFKRLFNKKIVGKELNELLLKLGTEKGWDLKKYAIERYNLIPFAYLDIKKKSGYGVEFDLDIYQKYIHRKFEGEDNGTISDLPPMKKVRVGIPYEELSKNPILKKYVKGKSLEKSLAVLSVASILASAFFISNNITGNAILTNNANSSGLIGAGLFVLGIGSWILARNI